MRQSDQVSGRFATGKTAGMLAFLAYHLPLRHPREVPVELLWPDALPDVGRDSLSNALSSLRRQLEPPGVPRGAVLVAGRAAVGLNPEAVQTDVAQSREALQAATETDSNLVRVQPLRPVARLYQGELLPGSRDEWVPAEQRQLAGQYFGAVRQLVGQMRDAGNLAGAIARAVSLDPLRDEAHELVMELPSAAWQPEAALAQYRALSGAAGTASRGQPCSYPEAAGWRGSSPPVASRPG